MSEGYLYELRQAQPARFRARGLDAAHRVAGRVHAAVEAALAEDPEIFEVEDDMYFREQPMPCDRSSRCRAALHYPGCAHT